MADILVVEDEIAIAMTLEALLEDEGHQVRVAEQGRAGLAAIAVRVPALVLTDTNMPEMTGPEMVSAMLDEGQRAIPVIVMSAMPEEQVRPAYRRCDAFIAKPFRLHQLAAMIRHILAEAEPR
ncbi:response regulator [Sphingomonas sp. ID0503]|uniref:response regulator n=1 Tax=Sphingomonas sp. ID0503 TaxID=3399691 RepID=UPI003AFB621A